MHACYAAHATAADVVPLPCQADLPGIGTVNAMSYGRTRSRLSYFVLFRRRTRLGSEQRRVARVQHFLLVQAQDRPLLRLAVCDVYHHQPPPSDGAVYVARAEQFERRAAAVPVDAVDAVLVSAELRAEDCRKFYQSHAGKIFFARHGNLSRLG